MTYDRTCPEPCGLGSNLLQDCQECRSERSSSSTRSGDTRASVRALVAFFSPELGDRRNTRRCSERLRLLVLLAVRGLPFSSRALSSLFRCLALALCFPCLAPAYIATTEKSRQKILWKSEDDRSPIVAFALFQIYKEADFVWTR